ncbi:unnamed protein product [Caenorhabditis bovis]|uniref:SXP/RAL-2 family protein Ani s 5-like cation-binding domain-containing protein n=1 Tax=Caenorhabditis bovis TaxID=2654633 RepID=A0A8S1E8V3_9PELO|nr:unnamed protein product [Caenorhabditis bovis]
MFRRLLLVSTVIACVGAQFAQQRQPVQALPANVQAAPAEQSMDGIPAWYQMSKQARPQTVPQAAPAYYERMEPTYETRREQPTYERPGIQSNHFANYPSYQNRQPYENLNALTSGASLNQLQNRRFPSANGGQSASGTDMNYSSALKRYHKLLLRRKPWSTKIPRILASTTPKPIPRRITPKSTVKTTTEPTTTTTTQKMPKSLKSIYSTILPHPKVESTTRSGWKMWKKVTHKGSTSEIPTTIATSTTTTSTGSPTTKEEHSTTPATMVVEETSTTPTTKTTEKLVGSTEASTTTTTTEITTTEDLPTTREGTKPPRYICRHSADSNERDLFRERRPLTTIGPFRPIIVGNSWKPLKFKKPSTENSTAAPMTTRNPKGMLLLEYLLKQTDIFARDLQKAFDGPNTELLAAIKDVVAKFKASLDEAGIDQDVRLMSNQLRNTWQQLRTGIDRGVKAVRQSAENSVTHLNYGPQLQRQPPHIPYQHHQAAFPGPMNEQLGRLFEKAAADAADQKQQQQHQKMASLQ